MGYTGNSIVDYLKSTGQATDFASRAKLASEKGISGYSGTAEQNTQLLNSLRGGSTPASSPSASPVSTPSVSPVSVAPVATGTIADNGKLYGGWYDNPATGRNQRYWGNGVWTDGEEPNAPKSSEGVTPYLNQYQNSILNKSMPEVRNMLTEGKAAPALLNLEQTFTELRADYGLADLESSLNSLKAQEQDIQAAFRTQRTDERGRPVAQNVIEGRIGEEERAAQERLDFIARQKSVIIDELNTKYSVIGQIMNFKQVDYQTAVDDYERTFNQNLQVYNLISSEADRQQTAARANLQIYANAITNGNMDYNSLSSDQKLMLNKLEMQSGLPVGFVSSLKLDPGANILFTSTNEGVTQVGVRNPDGSISVQSYGTRTPGKQTDAEFKKGAQTEMGNFLNGKANSYGHVSGSDYLYARNKWVTEGGGNPDDFDTLFRGYRDPYNLGQYNLKDE